eukprot:CAMPEP_0194525826 /NCGR_PEP_ID=MMETSP0253-20130528/61427_1 /TAXON_ID=2966 /ORGANISM="Noctiluca scintillans" /LENGTH=842 /DNA_ID=CAMNT_0039370593 /DNA_START=55 /DNA_END=2586 /DNA_ORIENTATION=-
MAPLALAPLTSEKPVQAKYKPDSVKSSQPPSRMQSMPALALRPAISCDRSDGRPFQGELQDVEQRLSAIQGAIELLAEEQGAQARRLEDIGDRCVESWKRLDDISESQHGLAVDARVATATVESFGLQLSQFRAIQQRESLSDANQEISALRADFHRLRAEMEAIRTDCRGRLEAAAAQCVRDRGNREALRVAFAGWELVHKSVARNRVDLLDRRLHFFVCTARKRWLFHSHRASCESSCRAVLVSWAAVLNRCRRDPDENVLAKRLAEKSLLSTCFLSVSAFLLVSRVERAAGGLGVSFSVVFSRSGRKLEHDGDLGEQSAINGGDGHIALAVASPRDEALSRGVIALHPLEWYILSRSRPNTALSEVQRACNLQGQRLSSCVAATRRMFLQKALRCETPSSCKVVFHVWHDFTVRVVVRRVRSHDRRLDVLTRSVQRRWRQVSNCDEFLLRIVDFWHKSSREGARRRVRVACRHWSSLTSRADLGTEAQIAWLVLYKVLGCWNGIIRKRARKLLQRQSFQLTALTAYVRRQCYLQALATLRVEPLREVFGAWSSVLTGRTDRRFIVSARRLMLLTWCVRSQWVRRTMGAAHTDTLRGVLFEWHGVLRRRLITQSSMDVLWTRTSPRELESSKVRFSDTEADVPPSQDPIVGFAQMRDLVSKLNGQATALQDLDFVVRDELHASQKNAAAVATAGVTLQRLMVKMAEQGGLIEDLYSVMQEFKQQSVHAHHEDCGVHGSLSLRVQAVEQSVTSAQENIGQLAVILRGVRDHAADALDDRITAAMAEVHKRLSDCISVVHERAALPAPPSPSIPVRLSSPVPARGLGVQWRPEDLYEQTSTP